MDKTIEYYNQNADMFAQGTRLVDFTVVQERFRIISGNPRQFNYRDESAGVCISAQCKQCNSPHPLLKYKYKK